MHARSLDKLALFLCAGLVLAASAGPLYAPPETNALKCGNGSDDDGDGLIDCEDPDCCTLGSCTLFCVTDSTSCFYDGICSAQGVCTPVGDITPRSIGAECDDGDACTIGEICDGTGDCGGGGDTDCSDGDLCTDDSCDANTGQCVNDPIDCNDDDACTDDSCDANTGQCINASIDCDDSDACTTDTCDTVNGCEYAAVDCDDNDACTTDTCDTVNGCEYAAVDCDDNDACTTDTCDTTSGCEYAAVDCDDNDACTTDTCDTTNGCEYAAVDCDDQDVCTSDSCDTQNGCEYTDICGICGQNGCEQGEDSCSCPADCGNPLANEGDCDDGKDEDCDNLFDCDDPDCFGNPVCCGDGVCDSQEDPCDCPQDCSGPCCGDASCEPGENPCNCGVDCASFQDPEVSCEDGFDNDCDDAIDCADGDCSQVQACIIPERCDNGRDDDGDNLVDCADPDCDGFSCDDGAACTTNDVCVSARGGCFGTPRHASCDDGQFCNGSEQCDPRSLFADDDGCIVGSGPCPTGTVCDDGGTCHEAECRDGIDNDGDINIDCQDVEDCPCPAGSLCNTSNGLCTEQVCDDGIDNDRDGLPDCLDPDCLGRPCDDGIDCTDDAATRCQPDGGCPLGVPRHSRCSDDAFCNGGESCQPLAPGADPDTGCLSTGERCAGPGEACDEINDRCFEVACRDRADNDGDGPPDCLDPDCICARGSICDEQTALCVETDCADGEDNDGDQLPDCADPDCAARPCDDGVACTTGDICRQRECVATREDGLCDDGVDCTSDSCSPGAQDADAGGCTNRPDDGQCDDGMACTVGRCHPENGCTQFENDSACDDGDFCNGEEVCDPSDPSRDADGCVDGLDPCTDPGEDCDPLEEECIETACRDELDNDGDGRADCADSDCPATGPEECLNGIDDDCDGLIDCDDSSDCGPDADGDGHRSDPCGSDCDDDDPNVNPGREEACGNQVDDDCDQLVDCADPECREDGDGDGEIPAPCGRDCDDDDPNVFSGALESCANGKDDDCDGLVDCEDPECEARACDDATACSSGDVCEGGRCIGFPESSRCDDGWSCTRDECVLGQGCRNTPLDARCDDGAFCNGSELCDPQDPRTGADGCVPGIEPCGAEQDCDEVQDTCTCAVDVHESDDACGSARLLLLDQDLRSEEHSLCPEGDVDRVAFDVELGRTITLFSTGGVDTLGVLTRADCGAQLARSNDCSVADRNFCLTYTPTFTGRVVLSVSSGVGEPAAAPPKPGTGPGSGASDEGALALPGRPDFEQPGTELQAHTGPYTLWWTESSLGCFPDAYEPADDDCSTATAITPTPTQQSENHTICPPGDIDRWVFRGEAGVTYRFQTTGSTDTLGRIRAENCGPILAASDDCNGDPNFCLEFTPQQTGFFVVIVRGQLSITTGEYQFLHQVVGGGECQADPAEPDDGCNQATPITVGTSPASVARSLCPAGDRDHFRFEAEAGKVYVFRTTGGTDTRIVIGPNDCSVPLADEATCGPTGFDACVAWRAPADGFYKVRVQGRQVGVEGDYQLHFVQEDCPVDAWEPDDFCGQATGLVVDEIERRQHHTICPVSENDLYEFFAEAGSGYRFHSRGSTDTGGAVLDEACKKFLIKDESSGAGENFDLTFVPQQTGIYKFGVTSDQGGPYDLYYQRVPDPGAPCVQDGAEPDDVCAAGAPITPSVFERTAMRSICPPDDWDHFTFQAQAGQRVRFWTTGDTDTAGNVRDDACSKLQGNDDCDLPDDLNFCLTFDVPVAGTYHLRVRGFSRDLTVGDYVLHYQLVP